MTYQMHYLLLLVFPLLAVPMLIDGSNYFRYSWLLLTWPTLSAIFIVSVSSRIVKDSLVNVTVDEETVVLMSVGPSSFIHFPREIYLAESI